MIQHMVLLLDYYSDEPVCYTEKIRCYVTRKLFLCKNGNNMINTLFQDNRFHKHHKQNLEEISKWSFDPEITGL